MSFRSSMPAANIWLCASWADEYRPSAFVILMIFCNLAVIKKITAKRATGILIPNLRKAPYVMRHFILARNILEISLHKLDQINKDEKKETYTLIFEFICTYLF